MMLKAASVAPQPTQGLALSVARACDNLHESADAVAPILKAGAPVAIIDGDQLSCRVVTDGGLLEFARVVRTEA